MHPQLKSVRLHKAQQRSAARRSAVPRLAVRFAVLFRAALCVFLNIPGTAVGPGTRYHYVLVVYSVLFAFFLRKNYTRTTVDQNVTSPTYSTAQTG